MHDASERTTARHEISWIFFILVNQINHTVTKSVAKVRVFFIATNAKTFFLSQKAVFLTYFNEKQSEFLFYLKQLHNFAATHSNTCKKRSTSRQGKYWPTHWSSFYWHWS
jgi:restriction endonuclease S subunit